MRVLSPRLSCGACSLHAVLTATSLSPCYCFEMQAAWLVFVCILFLLILSPSFLNT